jgi:NADPH-dependent curcumin reductase CurA
MPPSAIVNHRIVLHSRPVGAPTVDNFRLEERGIPLPESGQVLLRTLYLSLDPYMRSRMSDEASYTAPVAIDEVMVGGTVSCVEASQHPDYQPGEHVLGYSGWQGYALSDGHDLTKLDTGIGMTHYTLALGVLGMPGLTAYRGLLDIGQPQAGETVVVAAASEVIGSVAGQIAKLKDCRVIGIADGRDPCRFVVEELGFAACIDRYNADFSGQLAAVCPKGIDIYFENIGGAVFDAVLPLLNVHARIPLCGLTAHYNDSGLPQGPDRLGLLARTLLAKRIRMQGFTTFDDDGQHYEEFRGQMNTWVQEDKIKFREHIVDGLENAPQAFVELLAGHRYGGLLIRVGHEKEAVDEAAKADALSARS